MNHFIFSVLFVCMMTIPNSAFSQTQPEPNRNFIYTEGTAAVTGQNDSARASLEVRSEGREMEKTASENAHKTKAVIKAIGALKIRNLKLKTTNYRVTPQQDFKARPPKTKGYAVHNEIEVITEGFDPDELSGHVSKILGTALESGANNIRSIQFYIKDKQALEKEGLTRATQEAIDRAKILAKAAGVRLKRIASISTQPIPAPVRPQMFRAAKMAAEDGAMEPPIVSGESKIHVRVSIAYEFE